MIKILVDPGHAWNGNHYALQPGFYEGTQMWHLANYLIVELKNKGFYVETTRPKLKDFMDVADRGKMAKGFDLVVSLHSNAPGTNDTSVTGTYVIYTLSTPEIKPLADDMGQRISSLMSHRYRGSIIMRSESRLNEDRNSVLRNAIRVGCKAGLLIEHGFHTNPKDCAFLVNNDNLKKLAIAEAEAIAEYYYNTKPNGNMEKEGELMLKRTLRFGDSGEDVKLVQEFLKNHGYYNGDIDGKFGPGTGFQNAVIAFQKAEKLENPNGNIGPITRARIIEMMLQPKGVEKIVEVESPELKKKIEKLEADLKIANNNLIVVQDQVKNANAKNVKYKEYFNLQNELSK